jgi:hypothetical protein
MGVSVMIVTASNLPKKEREVDRVLERDIANTLQIMVRHQRMV